MKAYNLADLEAQLSSEGWTITGEGYVNEHATPGQVHDGGYLVVLHTPNSETFCGRGATRSDALRTAATNAGLIEPGQPNLI
jgi:hypothetical protein